MRWGGGGTRSLSQKQYVCGVQAMRCNYVGLFVIIQKAIRPFSPIR